MIRIQFSEAQGEMSPVKNERSPERSDDLFLHFRERGWIRTIGPLLKRHSQIGVFGSVSANFQPYC